MAMRLHGLDALFDLQRAMEAARQSGWFGSATTGYGTFPPVNVLRQGHDFVLVAELPGIDRSKLDVQVKGRQVRIKGTKSAGPDSDVSVHRRERRAGAFDRTLVIPADIDGSRVKAEYQNGVLTLHLPRVEADRPRSVEIH